MLKMMNYQKMLYIILDEIEIKFENKKEEEFKIETKNDLVLNQICMYLNKGYNVMQKMSYIYKFNKHYIILYDYYFNFI